MDAAIDFVESPLIDCFTTYYILYCNITASTLTFRLGHNQSMSSPGIEYARRLENRQAGRERLSRTEARLAAARLVAFGAALLLGIAALRGMASSWLLLAPALVFVGLVWRHDRIIRARDACTRAVDFYERGIARIEDRWAGGGDWGERFRDDRHLYGNDLDLFGRASLFELLSTARTEPGKQMLASWLLAAAPPEEIRERQTGIQELAATLDLREELAVAGVSAPQRGSREPLVEWAEAPAALAPPALQWVGGGLTVAVVATLAFWYATGEPLPALISLVIAAAFVWPLRNRLDQAIAGTEAAAHELDILGHLLHYLERAEFQAPMLARLRQQLETDNVAASHAVRGLHGLMAMHDWHHNLVFRLLSLPLMWRLHLAFAIERWRTRHGRQVRHWIAAVAEFEALSSLAAYRYEHPDDPFPEVVSDTSGNRPPARFEGTALGHPLLPAARMVRNDVRLDERTRLLVVSGSNMSGKSTLLRTVGINAVMGLAGAPVRAVALRLSPLTVGATLRIQDSLQEGRSRFYAEITRIRELADAANGPAPLLFLLDELFHGTNSHDRLVGASGVLRSLVDRGAIGLITTHDLALTAVADELAPRAENIHFEDSFDGGEIRFDYRAKPGRVTKSNALALMQAVGLDVRGT